MKEALIYFGVIFLVAAFMAGYEHQKSIDKDVLYQVSTLNALMLGDYNGEVSFRELGKHGDFGIGTFENLDGEMIELDGKFYQIKVDGEVYDVSGKMKTPFSMVTKFNADKIVEINSKMDCADLQDFISMKLESKNLFYAVRVNGRFNYIKARSVPSQENGIPLSEAVALQSIFEFYDVNGDMVGFNMPYFAEKINNPGWHFHFIIDDKKSGGHVLDCEIKDGAAYIDSMDKIFVDLPENDEFLKMNLAGGGAGDLE